MNARQERLVQAIRDAALRYDAEGYEDLGPEPFVVEHFEVNDLGKNVSVYMRTQRKDGRGVTRCRHIFVGPRGRMFRYVRGKRGGLIRQRVGLSWLSPDWY
jgi:hypothetical protein